MEQLFYLRTRGFTVALKDGRISLRPRSLLDRYHAIPDGAAPDFRPLGPEIVQRITDNRAAIIAALADPDAEPRFWEERAAEYGRLGRLPRLRAADERALDSLDKQTDPAAEDAAQEWMGGDAA